MENNGLFSNLGSSGMLGLEMSLHPQNHQHLHHHQSQMMQFEHNNPQTHPSTKQNYPNTPTNHKQTQHVLVSDDDEPMGGGGDDGDGDSSKRKGASQWQRMKWTDGMVKLLIMAVYYIGDDQSGNEAVNIDVGTGKKKSGAGVLQKKGKWKSVSKAMMEKGFSVSPQQCEDKFNDLNKRYKRVNDVLGKGIACKVVENQSLLDSMDHLSSKMKNEVRKLLNSKHLFFREMCAYHNSFGLGCSQAQEETTAGPSNHHRHDRQRCYHSPDDHVKTPNSGKTDTEGSKMGREKNRDEDDDDDEDCDDDDDDGEDEEEYEDGNHGDEGLSRKRTRKGIQMPRSPLVQQFSNELMNVMNDESKKAWEKKQWVETQWMKLEEQRVCYLFEAFELEKQRLKWEKFSSNKEREMERAKLKNEQTKLENERMTLLLRQKELELIEHQHYQQQQHSSNKRGDPSSITR